jgi:hypothetical protein
MINQRPSLQSTLEFMELPNGKMSLHLEIDKDTFWKLTKTAAEDEQHIEEWIEIYLTGIVETTKHQFTAQSVTDAFLKAPMGQSHVDDDLIALAAALRAAANQLTHATSAHTLYAIADELEGNR